MKIPHIILTTLILLSCEKFMVEEDFSYIDLNTKKEQTDLLNGIYYLLLKAHDQDYLRLLSRADDVNMYLNYNFIGSCSHSATNPYDEDIRTDKYLNLYQAVINANQLIHHKNTTDLMKGEAYFLRAYSYFKLVRFFKTPPLVTDIDVNFNLERPTVQEVYNLILSDIDEALELLPENNNSSRIPDVTPHKGTAKAVLAEVYLTMAGYPLYDTEKYQLAAQTAKDVINNYNYRLEENILTLWSPETKQTSENIFALFSGPNNPNLYIKAGVFQNETYDETNAFHLEIDYLPEMRFFDQFPNDTRKSTTYITGHLQNVHLPEIPGNSDLEFEYFYNSINAFEDPCTFLDYAFTIKYFDPNNTVILDGWEKVKISTKPLMLYRLAQTMLTYAEASVRSGTFNNDIIEQVNIIRRRANNVDLNTKSEFDLPENITQEQFIDSVVWERAYELSTEPEGRWFDIIRLDLKDELTLNRYEFEVPTELEQSIVGDDWYFLKIPEYDIALNPNLSDSIDN